MSAIVAEIRNGHRLWCQTVEGIDFDETLKRFRVSVAAWLTPGSDEKAEDADVSFLVHKSLVTIEVRQGKINCTDDSVFKEYQLIGPFLYFSFAPHINGQVSIVVELKPIWMGILSYGNH